MVLFKTLAVAAFLASAVSVAAAADPAPTGDESADLPNAGDEEKGANEGAGEGSAEPARSPEEEKIARRKRVAEYLSPETRTTFESWDESAFDAFGAKVNGQDTDVDALSDTEKEILSAYQMAAFEDSLNYQSGEIAIDGNLATIRLDDDLRFLGPEDARKILVDAWGNPPGAEPLGMLFPRDVSPLTKEGWGVVITYSDDGHVDDEDAAELDYDELLAEMQEDSRSENQARKDQGYNTVDLIGWAEPPHYDSASHRLYWAKELAFSDTDEHTLNYSIRVLGRRGVLELNAVAGMSQLALIKPKMESILTTVEFNPGNRYDEFDSSVDKVAAYGIGGLVAGKVLVKTGLLAGLLKGLIAAKKLIVVFFLGIGAVLGRLFRRRRTESETPPPGDDPVP